MSARDAMGLEPGRNAFGDLLIDPDRLTQRGRIDVVRRLSGRWQAATDREVSWAGRKLGEWLHGPADGNLVVYLGLQPPRGSHATAPAVVGQLRRDAALLRLSVLSGGDAAAMRTFEGDAPSGWSEVMADLGDFRPQAASCFSQARARLLRHTP